MVMYVYFDEKESSGTRPGMNLRPVTQARSAFPSHIYVLYVGVEYFLFFVSVFYVVLCRYVLYILLCRSNTTYDTIIPTYHMYCAAKSQFIFFKFGRKFNASHN